ncbi:MAG: hypothetical protein CEO40_72 [Parcubacteria group bacterium LiPW_72]|nr:MAG: hypothetical protein CEO40_72 [Parcubacteria group bacterium LiPW_72]
MSELTITFSKNWSTEITRMAERRGIKPENLILDALTVLSALEAELASGEGNRGLALMSPRPHLAIIKEIVIPRHVSHLSTTTTLTIEPTLAVD